MSDWFTIDHIDKDTHIISEYRHWEETHAYLLNGSTHSLLIDTGLGIENIYEEVIKMCIRDRSYTGDRIVFRTMMPADKPRNVGLAVHGHLWKEQPKDPFSRIIPLQGGISIGNKFDMELSEGAACPGDYLYRSGSLKWDIESGMWGILRVLRQSLGCKCKKMCIRDSDRRAFHEL